MTFDVEEAIRKILRCSWGEHAVIRVVLPDCYSIVENDCNRRGDGLDLEEESGPYES